MVEWGDSHVNIKGKGACLQVTALGTEPQPLLMTLHQSSTFTSRIPRLVQLTWMVPIQQKKNKNEKKTKKARRKEKKIESVSFFSAFGSQ